MSRNFDIPFGHIRQRRVTIPCHMSYARRQSLKPPPSMTSFKVRKRSMTERRSITELTKMAQMPRRRTSVATGLLQPPPGARYSFSERRPPAPPAPVPESRLSIARRELQSLDVALVAAREQHELRMKSLRKRKEELRWQRADLDLKIPSMAPKLELSRGLSMCALDRAWRRERFNRESVERIAELKKAVSKLLVRKAFLASKVDTYQRLGAFVERCVREHPERFPSFQLMYNRHASLLFHLQDMQAAVRRNNRQLREGGEALLALMRSQLQAQQALTQRVTRLKHRLREAQEKTLRSEEAWLGALTSQTSGVPMEVGTIRLAVSNMYSRARQHTHLMRPVEDTLEQLSSLELFILDRRASRGSDAGGPSLDAEDGATSSEDFSRKKSKSKSTL